MGVIGIGGGVSITSYLCLFELGDVDDGVQLVRLVQGSWVEHVVTLYHVITS